MTTTNSTTLNSEKLQQPAKLTPEQVSEVSESIPALVEWLGADTTKPAREDNRLKDPKVVAAVIDVLDAIQAANQRAIDKIDKEQRLIALRVTDLRDLITAAIAEPGSVPTDRLLRDASVLSEQASARDMQPIWELLGKLEEVQPTPPDPADVAIWADHLCYVSITMKPWEHMGPAAAALYHAGCELLDNEPESAEIKTGWVLMLDALIAAPEAAQHVVRHLRTLLVESEPRLAMFKR